jgi:hypothetical protein
VTYFEMWMDLASVQLAKMIKCGWEGVGGVEDEDGR